MASLKRNAIRVTYLKEFARPALAGIFSRTWFLFMVLALIRALTVSIITVLLGRTYFYDHYRYSPVLGIDGYLGLEYHFPRLACNRRN